MQELGKKLQLQQQHRLLLLHAPPAIAQALREENLRVTEAVETPATGVYAAILLFARDRQELEELAPEAISLLQPEGMLWVAYPKKSSGIVSDLTRDEGWKALAELGYGPVRQVAVDETWSALRFRREAERKKSSRFGADLPGIDRKTKTVLLPDDLREALEEAQLLAVFEGLAFTHRKEHVVAVLEAKRPDTRARRIGNIVAKLQEQASGKV